MNEEFDSLLGITTEDSVYRTISRLNAKYKVPFVVIEERLRSLNLDIWLIAFPFDELHGRRNQIEPRDSRGVRRRFELRVIAGSIDTFQRVFAESGCRDFRDNQDRLRDCGFLTFFVQR